MSSSAASESPPDAGRLAALEILPWQGEILSPQRLRLAVLAFLLLGLAARSVRYFLRFPLWEDECFLLVNFLDRGYVDMTQALNLHQVAPILFLWVQVSIIKLLGFTEYSVRLLPFLCGLGSLFLFRHLASRLLGGGALLLAIGIFAVAYPGIRYAAEAKPYGSDLFVSLTLMVCFVEWWRQPGSNRWLWGLAAAAPLAVGLSYPAVFVAGGISLAVAWVIWSTRSHRGWLPWVFFNLLLVGSFLAHFFLVSRHQTPLDWMQVYWTETFPPPLTSPLQFLGWFVVIHTGDLLAYPVGGGRGASTGTAVCFVVGLIMLFRTRRFTFLLFALAPLALTFVAAALQRYPYGGHSKFAMHIAPLICMLAGMGAATLLGRYLRWRPRHQAVHLVLLAVLALVGAGSIGRDVARPYKTRSDLRARSFARWFYFNTEFEGEVVCLKTDLGQVFAPPQTEHELSWEAMYLCNQRIYSPRHARGESPRYDRVTRERPLRCVQYRVSKFDYDEEAFSRWFEQFKRERGYRFVGKERYAFPRFDKRERRLLETDYIEIYKFVPRSDGGRD